MPETTRAKMTEGPVASLLLRGTVPMFFAMLGMVAFNLVDTLYIGHLGTRELAALSFTFPVVFCVGGFTLGLGAGVNALISRAIGEGEHGRVQRLATDGLLLSLILVAILLAAGFLSMDAIFTLLGAKADMLPLIRSYMTIWFAGILAVVVPMVGNNVIRATGDMKTPSLIMLCAVLLNAGLDPLLIFGLGPFPAMGLRGAALATVLARGISLLVALYILYHRERMLTFVRPRLREVLRSWREILWIGLPSAATNITIPVGAAVLVSLIARYGEASVAGYGVAVRLEHFSRTVVMALSTVLGPFVGQNLGARRFGRVHEGVRLASLFSLAWGALLVVFFFLSAPWIAALFNADAEVQRVVVLYLRILPLAYGVQGWMLLNNVTLNVLRRPLDATAIILVYIFAFTLPLAWLGGRLADMAGLFAGMAAARIISGTISAFWGRRRRREAEAAVLEEARPAAPLEPPAPDATDF